MGKDIHSKVNQQRGGHIKIDTLKKNYMTGELIIYLYSNILQIQIKWISYQKKSILPELSQENIGLQEYRPITSKVIERVVKNLQTKHQVT